MFRIAYIIFDFIIFILCYCICYIPNKLKERETYIGLGHKWFSGNIEYLYYELAKHSELNVYYVTPIKENVEKLRNKGINAYYINSIKNSPLFLRTKIWVTSSGHTYIPFSKAKLILKKLLGTKTEKWVDIWHTPLQWIYNRRGTTIENYDLLFVTSENYKNFLLDGREKHVNKIKVTGMPRTDPLIGSLDRNEMLKQLNLSSNRKNILYAPHRAGKRFISINKNFMEFLTEIDKFCFNNNCNFLFRFHPAWYFKATEQEKQTLRIILDHTEHIYHLSSTVYLDPQKILYVTDVLITDWSSIACDFMLLNKPIIFLDIPKPLPGDEEKIDSMQDGRLFLLQNDERFGYIVNDKEELLQTLQKAITKPKLFKRKRKIALQKIYKYVDSNSSNRCVKEIIRLL